MKPMADVLLADFNVYRAQTKFFHRLVAKNAFMRLHKMTDERRELLDELVTWCRERHIEPRLWMYFLFRTRQWHAAPKLERGNLMSERLVDKYKRGVRALGFFDLYMRRTSVEDAAEAAFDPNRDTTSTVEAMKRTYLMQGQTERCMEEIPVRTLGFHPKSPVCVACSVQQQCVVKLQGYLRFNVIALRLGQITSTEAEAQARKGL